MSRELFKGMTYRNNKVFTRQCSNNVYPKHYYMEENKHLTKLYNELGEIGFEKWFLTNGLMQGTIEILNGSNKILRRLDYLSNLLWKDKKFMKLYDEKENIFRNSLSAESKNDKEIFNKEYKKIEEDIVNYISSFYDIHNSRYKDFSREK